MHPHHIPQKAVPMALSMAEYSAACLVDRKVAMKAVWMVARKRAEEKGVIN